MSVENELEQRLNLQEGDEVTFVRDRHRKYVDAGYDYGLSLSNNSSMNHLVIVKRQSGKMGIYTMSGDVIVPENTDECEPIFYDDLDDYCHELISIRKGKCKGLLSSNGKEIIPCMYDRIELFGWYILVFKNSLCGAYSYAGKQILETEFDCVKAVGMDNCVALICRNKYKLYGVYSKDGEEIIPCRHKKIKYEESNYHNPNHFFEVAKENGCISLYTFDGKEITEDQVDYLKWGDSRDRTPIFANSKFVHEFMLAFKDDSPAILYKNTGKKIVPEVAKYAKMYLEQEYVICIGNDGITMDAYDFEGNKLFEYKP